jgi:hypothetical protein
MKDGKKPAGGKQVCVEPSIGGKVYDYYNGALKEDEAGWFERHLIGCPYCERVILELDHAIATLNDEQDFDLANADAASSDRAAGGGKTARRAKRQKKA